MWIECIVLLQDENTKDKVQNITKRGWSEHVINELMKYFFNCMSLSNSDIEQRKRHIPKANCGDEDSKKKKR